MTLRNPPPATVTNTGGGSTPQPPHIIESVLTQDGATTFPLSATPLDQGHALEINGLRQATQAYQFEGQTLVLPDDLELLAGDFIQFSYYV